MQTHDYFCLLNKKEGKKNVFKSYTFFFFLARVLCDILKGFGDKQNQRLAGCIARKPPISTANRSDIQPKP